MKLKKNYEYIIIGSGFGGSIAAYNLSKKGRDVLVVERGKWVIRDDTCWDEVALHTQGHLYRGVPFYADQNKNGKLQKMFTDDTVGGMSTMYGAVSFRMREEDFLGAPVPGAGTRNADTAWPFAYKDLAPFYDEAERILGIAGIAGMDVTEPPRNGAYLHEPERKLSQPSKLIYKSAKKLGLKPFYLPMAINFSGKYGKEKCILCSTCDHYLCKIEAKNDLSVIVLPQAIKRGVQVLDNARVMKINFNNRKAKSVEMLLQETGEEKTINGKTIIVAGGALNSPHLLLASGIGNRIDSIMGRYLFRHANGVVSALFPFVTNPEKRLQKQIGIPDYYHGAQFPLKEDPIGPWGMIQDVSSIGKEVVKQNSPRGLKTIAGFMTGFLINLMVMAEDIPQYENRVYADPSKPDKYGMPGLIVRHRYHKRDIEARKALYKKSKKILLRAGGVPVFTMGFDTYSHAMGTCRMGTDRNTSVVDPECRLWDLDNLYVTDASVMPSGGAVNPSLTIAALSLRASEILASAK